MNQKETLKKIVEDSSLELDQKTLWYKFIETSREKDIEAIVKAVEDDKSNLEFLTKNLQDKIQALQSDNDQDWDKVVEGEEEHLKEKFKNE